MGFDQSAVLETTTTTNTTPRERAREVYSNNYNMSDYDDYWASRRNLARAECRRPLFWT
jgi:hypothetical protein